jgi:hypothetical protein
VALIVLFVMKSVPGRREEHDVTSLRDPTVSARQVKQAITKSDYYDPSTDLTINVQEYA